MRRRGLPAAIAVAAGTLAIALLLGSCADQQSSSPSPSETKVLGLTLDRLVIAPGTLSEPAPSTTAVPLAPLPATDRAITPPPPKFEGKPAPRAAPPAPLRRSSQFDGVVPTGGTWAVMVGINDYPGSSSDLTSAVNDANDVNEALAKMGVPADHRLVIRDGQASAGVIRAAADWLVAHASPDAVAVFFYGGHVRKLSSSTEAMVAADGALVTDADLASRLSKLQARRAWIAMAACYGGGFNEVMAPGRVLTAAAGADSIAYENTGFRRSYLVQYMVRQAMIEGRAADSVQSAFAFAHAAISRDYPGRQPVQMDSGSSPLDLRPKTSSTSSGTQPAGGSTSGGTSGNTGGTGGGSSGGSGGSGGTGGGTGGGTQPPQQDGCSYLSFGVVNCGGGR